MSKVAVGLAYQDEPFFDVDEEAKQLRFELHRDTYIPVAALKGLVKIGLTLIPDVETKNFRETYDWIRDTDHSRNFISELPVFRTFIPGPMPNDLIVLILMRRRADIDTVPYAFFTFAYGNHVLQVFLPSISQDKCINGKRFPLPPFPTPDARDPVRYGRPTVRVERLTGRQPVKGEKVPAVFGFDHREKGSLKTPRAEPDRDARPEHCRHSFAFRAPALGESLAMTGKLLGHNQVRTTAKYAHPANDSVKASGSRVGDSIGLHTATSELSRLSRRPVRYGRQTLLGTGFPTSQSVAWRL